MSIPEIIKKQREQQAHFKRVADSTALKNENLTLFQSYERLYNRLDSLQEQCKPHLHPVDYVKKRAFSSLQTQLYSALSDWTKDEINDGQLQANVIQVALKVSQLLNETDINKIKEK
jgi:hypothetical protein